MMDWEDHADAFQMEWITRYIAPGEAAWKEVLDSFQLYDNRGKCIYPEGRQILMMNLNVRQKANMLDRLPRKAECIRGFHHKRDTGRKGEKAGLSAVVSKEPQGPGCLGNSQQGAPSPG